MFENLVKYLQAEGVSEERAMNIIKSRLSQLETGVVRRSQAAKVRELIARDPELKAKIDAIAVQVKR